MYINYNLYISYNICFIYIKISNNIIYYFRGDVSNLMIRGDLFRLEKDLVPKKSKINNTFSNNFKFNPLIFMKKFCQNPEKKYIFKTTYILEYEWQHTASLLAKSLNYEV